MFKKLRVAGLCLIIAAAFVVTGCAKSGEQQYAWPLATASPEDTVTQIFAVEFANRVNELSNE